MAHLAVNETGIHTTGKLRPRSVSAIRCAQLSTIADCFHGSRRFILLSDPRVAAQLVHNKGKFKEFPFARCNLATGVAAASWDDTIIIFTDFVMILPSYNYFNRPDTRSEVNGMCHLQKRVGLGKWR